jgi:hypothetical protein
MLMCVCVYICIKIYTPIRTYTHHMQATGQTRRPAPFLVHVYVFLNLPHSHTNTHTHTTRRLLVKQEDLLPSLSMCLSLSPQASSPALNTLTAITTIHEKGHKAVVKCLEERREKTHEKHAFAVLVSLLSDGGDVMLKGRAMKLVNALASCPKDMAG